MSTAKRIISVLLCLAVFAGVFSVSSYAFPGLAPAETAAQEEEEKTDESAPETTVTVFGMFEAGPVLSRLIDAFPPILIFLVPFAVFYEIPYVVKDIFTSMRNRVTGEA